MEITVVVPVYNEAPCIKKTAEFLEKRLKDLNYKPGEYEILFVDDGSTDDTLSELKQQTLTNPSIRYIRTPHKGKGNALKTGLLHAQGEIIGIVDCDLEARLAEPEKLPLYLKQIKTEADIIIGSKRHPKTRGRICPLRRLLSIAFNKLTRILTGLKINDTQSGLKIIRKKVIDKILPLLTIEGFSLDVELLAIANMLKYKIKEIPIKINMTNNFKTTNIIKMLIELLKITYHLKATKHYQIQITKWIKTHTLKKIEKQTAKI